MLSAARIVAIPRQARANPIRLARTLAPSGFGGRLPQLFNSIPLVDISIRICLRWLASANSTRRRRRASNSSTSRQRPEPPQHLRPTRIRHIFTQNPTILARHLRQHLRYYEFRRHVETVRSQLLSRTRLVERLDGRRKWRRALAADNIAAAPAAHGTVRKADRPRQS